MGGNNMESLLMDDSSSGESDDEVNVPMGSNTTTTAASAVNVPAPVPAPAPNPAPAPAPSAPAPAARGRSSQADQMARLKSLYNISKSTGSSSTSTGGGVSSQGAPAAPKPLQRPPMQSSQRPPQQQPMQPQPSSRQRPSHPQMQQRQHQQPVGSRPMTQQQQHHQRAQLYKQSSQQVQQQQPMPSRSQPQQRQPQYSQPPTQQRQQYSQQQQQQSIPSRSSQSQQRQPQYSQPSSQQRPQYVSQSRGGSSSQQQSQQAAVDPYAPTPLSQIKQSSHSRRTHQQQQMQSQRQSTKPMTSRMQPLQGSSAAMAAQEVKRQKEKFLMFTRVLIKYLEQKDQAMHQQAKIIIKDCAERNKRQEAGYESVTQSMKRRLKELVGEHYWKKANDYLVHFIEQKKRQAQGRGATGSVAQQHEDVRRRKAQLAMQQQRRMKEPLQVPPQQKVKQEPPNVPKQRQPVPAVAGPSVTKREQVPIEAQTTTTAKATSKTKSKSGTSSKASGSESKTTAKPKTTKKTVRRKSTGDASTTSRKSTTSKTTPASSSTTTIVKRIVVEEPPREYKELMEVIDHAVEYNWPQIGQLLGNKADLKLTEEERQLLYGDSSPGSFTKKKALKAPTKASASTPVATKSDGSQDQSPSKKVSDEQTQVDVDTMNKDGIRQGWGRSNVLSARAAWARIRLKELRQRKIEAANSSPVVADGLLSLPIVSQQPQEQQSPSATSTTATTPSTPGQDTDTSVAPKPVEIEGSWVNEEVAEQDKALALLSESCQIYLKGVLQKAVQCARQRQNLDGIRLWHQQYAFNKGTFGSASKSMDKSKKPPLALRLGCDVSRQAAQAQGNAALTVKRMEEALDRQTGVPMRVRELNTETLLEATSMGDLSWRPLLKKGAEKADYHAKRSFEVYGGKEAKDPPLGRVPKKAKLLVEDFVMGSELVVDGPYHKAYTASSFVSF